MPTTSRTIRISAAAIVVVLSLAFFFWIAIHALFYVPSTEVAIPGNAIPVTSATSSLPARLIIPALNINANVQDVGITQSHAMSVPNNFTDVGWYKYGVVPGALGSAVIDGHVDNGLSLAGVFKHLADIKIGDDVIVVAKDGSQKHFVVVDTETYPYQTAPSASIFDRATDTARLNLITCEGSWVPANKTYDHRLVVYTKLISE